MEIKVLGTGCKNCTILANNTKQAIENLKLETEIIKIEDIGKIIAMGVMSTPALVVNGEVKSLGKVVSIDEIEKILKEV